MSVCRSGRSLEAIRPEAKKSFFSASVDLDVISNSPLTRLAIAPAATKVRKDGGLVNTKGRLSGVNIVQGCFPGGGNSIQSVFSWEPLRANLQDYQRLSLASWTHDQQGCVRALWYFCYDMALTVIDAAHVQGVSEQSELTPGIHYTYVSKRKKHCPTGLNHDRQNLVLNYKNAH